MDKAKENLFKAFQVIAESVGMSFDQTKVGRIVEILPNNRYKIQIHSDVYTVKSQFDYNVDERVFILFPCGSSTDLYLYPNKYNVVTSDTEPSLVYMTDGDV